MPKLRQTSIISKKTPDVLFKKLKNFAHVFYLVMFFFFKKKERARFFKFCLDLELLTKVYETSV